MCGRTEVSNTCVNDYLQTMRSVSRVLFPSARSSWLCEAELTISLLDSLSCSMLHCFQSPYWGFTTLKSSKGNLLSVLFVNSGLGVLWLHTAGMAVLSSSFFLNILRTLVFTNACLPCWFVYFLRGAWKFWFGSPRWLVITLWHGLLLLSVWKLTSTLRFPLSTTLTELFQASPSNTSTQLWELTFVILWLAFLTQLCLPLL